MSNHLDDLRLRNGKNVLTLFCPWKIVRLALRFLGSPFGESSLGVLPDYLFQTDFPHLLSTVPACGDGGLRVTLILLPSS